jgi:DNA-binding transcriptional LysR family regulator
MIVQRINPFLREKQLMRRWEGIEEFIQVVDWGSFSEAARHLGVSKSHVSKQVSRLEDRLGARLLHRTTRKLILTDSGKAYYERCWKIIEDLEEAEIAVTELQATPRGVLKMTVAGAFGERYIAPAIADFIQEYPKLSVDIRFTEKLVDLIEDGYDLAIRFGILQDSTLVARKIAPRRLQVVGSPAYFEKHGTPQNLNDLKKHNCLIGTMATWVFHGSEGVSEVKVQGNWHTNNGQALLAAAKKGLGITRLPDFYVTEAIEKGELVAVLEPWAEFDTSIWAVYPHNRHLSAKVRLLVDFLVKRFNAGYVPGKDLIADEKGK